MFGLSVKPKVEEREPPAAVCMGVEVPDSPYLNGNRVARINAGRYEEQEIIGALRVVRAGDTVLEMGTGLGIVGAVIARNTRPAKVMSFEANPDLIPHIEDLYQRNGLTDRISVENRVLWSASDRPKEVTLHVTNSFLGSSLVEKSNRVTRPVSVRTDDFNRLASQSDVLIIDIEGAELDILKHADLTHLRALVIEFHPEVYGVDGMREAKAIVREAGFQRIAACSSRTVWTCEKGLDL